MSFDTYHPHADFHALLSATEDDDVPGAQDGDVSAVDRDLEMLIEQHDEVEEVVKSATTTTTGVQLSRPATNGGGGCGGDGADNNDDDDASMDELEGVLDGREPHRESSLYDVGFGGT